MSKSLCVCATVLLLNIMHLIGRSRQSDQRKKKMHPKAAVYGGGRVGFREEKDLPEKFRDTSMVVRMAPCGKRKREIKKNPIRVRL